LFYQLSKGELKMLVFKYPSKKVLKESIGKPLRYIETSMFGAEYKDNGFLTGANRPHITGIGREFFANVTMQDGLIVAVK
jgi:hypothetical protein